MERPGWLSRNLKWVLPVGCFGALAIAIAAVAGVLSLPFLAIYNSDVYKQALMMAQTDPEAELALGRPIEAGWLISGNIHVANDSGEARMQIPVSGPRGAGRIVLEARKTAGKWTFEKLILAVDNGSQIDLLRDQRPI